MFSKLATTSAKRFSPKTMAPAAAGARAFSSESFPGAGPEMWHTSQDSSCDRDERLVVHSRVMDALCGAVQKEIV